jgi:ribosome-binding factor A
MSRRIERLNEQLREEISDLLLRQVKDPRLGVFITVTQVSVSPDLSQAKVYVSVMGSAEEKQGALKGLDAASAFIRHELGQRLSLRRIPRLVFRHDDSIEQGAHVLDLLDEVGEQEKSGP